MSPQSSAAVVRPVKEEDVPAIIPLLLNGFPGRFSADGLRGLFDYRWGDDDSKPNRGFALCSGERIVGFHGAVYATRPLAGCIVKTCNLSTWYVEPEFRWAALKLLYAILAQDEYTFLNLTPSQGVRRIMETLRFQPIDRSKLVYLPWHFPRQMLSPGPGLVTNKDQIANLLDSSDRRIFRDHLPYRVKHYLLHEGSNYSYLILKRRRFPGHAVFGRVPVEKVRAMWYPCMEVLYLKNSELALRSWGALVSCIIRRERVLAVVLGERFVGTEGPPAARFDHWSYVLSRSPLNSPPDNLYSELVVLEI